MKKSTIIALVIFLGLLVAVVLTMGGKTERGITRISFAAVDAKAIDRIALTGKNPVELKRQGEAWMLGDGRQADSSAVERLTEAIPKIESSDLVTKDSGRFAELEVDEEKGTRVAVYAGDKQLAGFIVGKAGSGGTHVRSGNEVYLVKRVYPYVFSKEASAWHKLKLFDTKLEEVSRVELSLAGGSTYALVKKEDNWELADPKVVPEGFRFDQNAARSLVSALLNLRAREIVLQPPDKNQTGLEQGYDRLALVDKDEKRQELHLGAATDKGDAYARLAGREDIYLLNKYSVESLKKRPTDLRDLKLVELDTEKVTKLSLVDGKRSLVLEKQGAEWKIAKSSEKIPADFELDTQLVQRRLQALANVRAVKLARVKSPAQAGLDRPSATVTATPEKGSKVSLAFGKPTKDEDREVVYARGNIDNDFYLVAKATLVNLTGGLSSFKKRPAPQGMPDLNPEALSKLPPEVRGNLMREIQKKKQQEQMLKAVQEQMSRPKGEKK